MYSPHAYRVSPLLLSPITGKERRRIEMRMSRCFIKFPTKNKSSKELIPLKLFHQIDMSYSN